MEIWEFILIGLAALGAGMVNAMAGGGTLITFPVLTALGLPAVSANITNTVALCPGYFGGSWAQRRDLVSQQRRLQILLPIAVLGGVGGGLLLIYTGEKLFREMVPWLILFASVLLALQPLIKKIVRNGEEEGGSRGRRFLSAALLILPATVYGGYFGAGLGVILMAVLGITHTDHLVKINALKQVLSLATNIAAAIFFLFSGQVNWWVALVMAVSALLGGYLGGKLASRMKPEILRWLVVAAGVVVFIIMLKQA